MCLEVNTRANIDEANSERRVGLSQNQHLADALRGVPPTTPICEARDVALCHLSKLRAELLLTKMATIELHARPLPPHPPTHCLIVRFTPLRFVHHEKFEVFASVKWSGENDVRKIESSAKTNDPELPEEPGCRYNSKGIVPPLVAG